MRASSSVWPIPVTVAPDKLAQIQSEFSREWLRISTSAQQGALAPPADRRFRSEAWTSNTASLLAAHTYLLTAKTLDSMVDAADIDEAVRKRLRFSIMQWVEASSPANFLVTNPDAQRELIKSNGQSLCRGMANLISDLQKGRLTQSDESQFELGKNVGITPGAVIYQNRLMQLIQYAPTTQQVYKKPLLVVPPCINKYYILDLQPENSFVRHAIDQGHTVFLVSWRNPATTDTDGVDQATWADYLQEGVLQAIDVASSISGSRQINALGFCVGGTLLASALSLAHARGKQPVSALTLLTTMLDFADTGVLDVFVDEQHAQKRDQELGQGGLMSARELGTTFSFLRPAELVWNYVEGNYLKGQLPPAFDLLYWNADGTNLPGPFFSWYFRNTYLENNLRVPGKVKVGEHALDLGTLSMPAYIYASRDDHIVPWQAAYATTGILGGASRFVLGASGHIAGVINPPAKKRRSYWAHDDAVPSAAPATGAAQWLDNAAEHSGSWWPDWAAWLSTRSGAKVRAPASAGNKKYTTLESAPGSYVKVRAQ